MKYSYGFAVVEVLVILFILFALGLAGYFIQKNENYNKHQASLPTALIISRSNPMHQAYTSAFTVNVKDTKKADALLADTHKLTPMTNGTYECPNDDGVLYTLQFQKPKVTVKADPTGCGIITVAPSQGTTNFRATAAFWKDLNNATGKPIDKPSNETSYMTNY